MSALPGDSHAAQHLHFYELVGKSITTSTPDRSLLAPNHTEAWDQAALSAQTRRLAQKAASPAAAGSAVSCRVAGGRFPTPRNQHGSHQAATNRGAETLQEQYSQLPCKEITIDTQLISQRHAAERRRSREGGGGESGSSVQCGDARRSIALPGRASRTGKSLSRCVSMIHCFCFREWESWRSGCCHKAGLEIPTGDSQINVGNCYSGARTRAK